MKHRVIRWFVCGVVLAAVSVAFADTTADHLAQLTEGVKQIARPGSPGQVCVIGPDAFAVVTGNTNNRHTAVVAAATLGRGRVVVFGHNGYLRGDTFKQHDTGRLIANAVRWAGGSTEPNTYVSGNPALQQHISAQRLNVYRGDGRASPLTRKMDVLVVADGWLDKLKPRVIENWVRDGGGLVVAGTGWGWLQLNDGKTLADDHRLNEVLRAAGLAIGPQFVKPWEGGVFAVDGEGRPLVNATQALDAVLKWGDNVKGVSRADRALAGGSITDALFVLPPDDKLLMPRIRRLNTQNPSIAVPTRKTPIRSENVLARVLLAYDMQRINRTPPEKVAAHPSAESFPGAVPASAKRKRHFVTITGKQDGWVSTGAYAAPGDLVVVKVPKQGVDKKLRVRIGCHKDDISRHDKWRRVPRISKTFPITKASTLTASAFGGLIYIEVPKGRVTQPFKVEITNAVAAPYYVLGETDLDDWRKTIRHHPAPWAELASGKVVVSVPSRHVRDLENPDELMKFWDKVSDASAELIAQPRDRTRPHRFVADEQISVGYMHSGYPIMTHLDAAATMAGVDRLRKGAWGLYHELGHNHQHRDWTFSGTTEVTCNLFSLYVIQTLCDTDGPGHGAMSPTKRRQRLEQHLKNGAPFDQWKSSPFLALTMYAQLQEAFGWDTYKRVFAEYRALDKAQRPRNDDEKRDQWMVRFSNAAGRNLGPFFQAWGVPTSQAARDSIAHLPEWMPDEVKSLLSQAD